MNLNRFRLKWKIFAFLLGFCALLLIVLWLFQTVFLDAFYRRIKVIEIRRSAAEIIHNMESENIEEIIRSISENNDITIDITDENGNSLLSAFRSRGRYRTEEDLSLLIRAKENSGEVYEYTTTSRSRSSGNRSMGGNRWNTRSSMQSLVYIKMTDNSLGEPIAVIIRAIISPVNATVTTLRYQLYFISAIILFLAIILATIIAKRVSKPIEEISQSAMMLANGNYDTRFSGKGFQEIVALSDTLNTAAIELGRVENLRRELLANISHDLRTPLSLIYNYAEMMNDFPQEITQEQTQLIIDETRRLTTLVNDVLDISKLENEIDKLNISHYNLTQCIAQTIEITEKLLKEDGFEITFSYDRDVFVNADKAKIDRAFYNLLINAVNYTGESKKNFC